MSFLSFSQELQLQIELKGLPAVLECLAATCLHKSEQIAKKGGAGINSDYWLNAGNAIADLSDKVKS